MSMFLYFFKKNVFTHFSVSSIKKMPNLSKEEILMKFNSMDAKLINARYRHRHISLIKKKKNIGNRKILKQYLLNTLIFN